MEALLERAELYRSLDNVLRHLIDRLIDMKVEERFGKGSEAPFGRWLSLVGGQSWPPRRWGDDDGLGGVREPRRQPPGGGSASEQVQPPQTELDRDPES